jgi:hypothetical protein
MYKKSIFHPLQVVVVKGKFHRGTGHESPEEDKGIALLFL